MQQIFVIRVFDTRNSNIKTLELKTTVPKSIVSNPVGFFIQDNSMETRVAFIPVSTTFIEKFNISVGANFGQAINHPCKIVIREGFSPFRMTRDINGRLVPQEPKKVPNLSFDVYLTKDGQPIYRHTKLELNPTEFDDVCIQHDPIPDEVRAQMKLERTGIYVRNHDIMSEPNLD